VTLIQPILVAALFIAVVVYLSRLRSKAADRLIVIVIFAISSLLVIHPELASAVAKRVGVGRGVDLVFYVAIPGLAFLLLLVIAKLRELNAKLTAVVREQALSNAHVSVREKSAQS
jgi:hypothetical protein